MELDAIAACVVGRCFLTGGRITLIGTLAGAFTLSSIQSYLVIMGVKPQGYMLLLAVIIVLVSLGDIKLRQ